MFIKIWQFETGNQFRKPALYIYFSMVLLFTVFTFATGSLPLAEKEHINAPYVIALWCAVMSMLISALGSAIMGLPLYRDIEYRTAGYYLAYPITPAGYFWGRYAGALTGMLFITLAIPAGIFLGGVLGPLMGWRDTQQYGPDRLSYYLHPFLTITIPNLIFTSSLYYGLVALTRNIKVIYSGGVLLFLGYFMSFFFLLNHHSGMVVDLADPFAINSVLQQSNNANSIAQNHSLIPISGNLLINRFLWMVIGLSILAFAYTRFNFAAYFRFSGGKEAGSSEPEIMPRDISAFPVTSFKTGYNRTIFFKLVRLELTNLLRDNYFWIIIASGLSFLIFSFWLGVTSFGVSELPRTVLLFNIFNDTFPFYLFLFILFYTGEIMHRERATRFAAINDSLPPPNWVLNGSKLTTLLLLGLGLALVPAVAAIIVQAGKGFHQFNFGIYADELFVLLIPRLLELTVFCYVIHVLVNHKFAAHGIADVLWVGMFFLNRSGLLNYHLLLYAYVPSSEVSDMDGLGHMLAPITWFNFYWMSCAGLLIILAALFYHRGVSSSFKERLQLLPQRFGSKTRRIALILIAFFLGSGGFIYYNVSYLNNYLTAEEVKLRQVKYERMLKGYADMPLPKVTSIQLFVDLYPDEQKALTRARVRIANRTNKPIKQLLIDGGELDELNINRSGKVIPFTYPLSYSRGAFNWFRPDSEAAEFRLYSFSRAIAPGDSLLLEVSSVTRYKGFGNQLYAQELLRNGTTFNGGLPGLGYDPGEEMSDPFERKKNHLPQKTDAVIAQNDPAGFNTLKAGPTAYVFNLDATVSTNGDQTAIAPGKLQNRWRQKGRNYFRYIQNDPGFYMPFHILSAKYALLHDTVLLDHVVDMEIYYLQQHGQNNGRFSTAFKDGLHYYSKAFGPYPFSNIRLAESSVYQNSIATVATLTSFNESFGWNANFEDTNQFDYCYFRTARALAQQWWRYQVAPNNTIGSLIISEGLSTYSALMLLEKKDGSQNMRDILRNQVNEYYFRRTRLEENEHPLATIDQPYLDGKAGVVLYGLRCLIGEDSLNAALRDFNNAFAFKNKPPFAGNNDLYLYLQKHVPDSLKYYLSDNWTEITFYDNKMIQVSAIPTGKENEYKVSLRVSVAKVFKDKNGNDVVTKNMNDVIKIAVFGDDSLDKNGRWQTNPIYIKNYKLSSGQHDIDFIINRKPAYAGIDPFATLMDRNVFDNMKVVTFKTRKR